MTFTNEGVLVLIASPGDAMDERAAVAFELNRWNAARAEREGVTLVPWLYERNAIPLMGNHPQSIINSQAVDRADVVIAIFDTRLGTKTIEAVSGTAEEIERAIAAGKRVHVYFSDEDIRRDQFNPQQFADLEAFRKSLEPRGLLGRYKSPEDIAAQARDALEFDIAEEQWGKGPFKSTDIRSKVPFRARHIFEREPRGTDKNGRIQYRTTTNRLVLEYDGTMLAEQIELKALPLDTQAPFRFDGPKEPFDMEPNSQRSWRLILANAGDVEVKLRWKENGNERNATITVSVVRS